MTTPDDRYSPAINRLHDFVMRVHTTAIATPQLGLVTYLATPQAISDINSVLKAGRYNSVRAIIQKPKPAIKRRRLVK